VLILVSKRSFVGQLRLTDQNPFTESEGHKEMALTQADVLAGIKEIVEEVAGIPAASIELDKNFSDDLEVDSLSMVEVVVASEERFGVKIPDDQVTELKTVGDAVNFIVKASA
jgi:acyl carrier protein